MFVFIVKWTFPIFVLVQNWLPPKAEFKIWWCGLHEGFASKIAGSWCESYLRLWVHTTWTSGEYWFLVFRQGRNDCKPNAWQCSSLYRPYCYAGLSWNLESHGGWQNRHLKPWYLGEKHFCIYFILCFHCGYVLHGRLAKPKRTTL